MNIKCTNPILSCIELATLLNGSLYNCPEDRIITKVKALEEADSSAISFLANTKYQEKAANSLAGLILVSNELKLSNKPQLIVANPYLAFAQSINLFYPELKPNFTNDLIHTTVKIGDDCIVANNVTIGARTVIGNAVCIHPGVHIGEDCCIGDNCELFSGVVLYRKTKLGQRVRIHSNTVIGSDGYGYVYVDGYQKKVPQVGWVEIENDVEIGACTTVDRGVLGPTIIDTGTKIDNQCQIGHNVKIGKHCLIVSQVGISGSTSLGDYVTLAGKVGTVGHIHIGSKSVVSGNSMIAKNIPDGSFVSGYLARPHRQWLECQAALNQLPKILKKLLKVKDIKSS